LQEPCELNRAAAVVDSFMPPKERNFNDVLLDEERHAHKWLQRFVLAAPIATAPMILVPLHYWLGRTFTGHFLISLYCFIAFMAEWSYIRAAFASPGRVLSTWVCCEPETVISSSCVVGLTIVPPFQTPNQDVVYVYPEKDTGIVPENRYCDVCQAPKPPRTSHCKFCERCTPKMDHHCGWTSNCVGEKNHKFFVLFVFYMTCLSSLFTLVVLLRVAAIIIHAEDVCLCFFGYFALILGTTGMLTFPFTLTMQYSGYASCSYGIWADYDDHLWNHFGRSYHDWRCVLAVLSVTGDTK